MGGAFDPVHAGHVCCLVALADIFSYDKLFFMPYGVSPTQKTIQASISLRTEMLEAVLYKSPLLAMETCEINRPGPAYTCDTLRELRLSHGSKCHIAFVLGDDAYAGLSHWKNWRSILHYANLLVVERTCPTLNYEISAMEKEAEVEPKDFLEHYAGAITKIRLSLPKISSSSIRDTLSKGINIEGLLPQEVLSIIKRENVYSSASQEILNAKINR